MHPIEILIADHRSKSTSLPLESVGGVTAILAEQKILQGSPFAADLVALLLDAGAVSETTATAPAGAFITACYSAAVDPLTLLELNDHLPAIGNVSKSLSVSVFAALIGSFEAAGPPELRRAALSGALAAALGHRSRELRLAAVLLEVDLTNLEGESVAKAVGLVWSRVREAGLVELLTRLAQSGSGAAWHELGTLQLAQALEALTSENVSSQLATAHSSFAEACASREEATDSHLMRLSIEALQKLISRQRPTFATSIAAEFSAHLFSFQSAKKPEAPAGWQVSDREIILSWTQIALTMDALAKHLWEPSWWEPSAVIGNQLLKVYAASRSFFRIAAPPGLDTVVRPALASSLFRSASQLHLLREWLRQNPDDAQAGDASSLISAVEGQAAAVFPLAAPDTAVPEAEGSDLFQQLSSSLSSAFEEALPASLRDTLETWLTQIDKHADLEGNANARVFIGQIVFFVLHFLHACTDRASPIDPLSSYLFNRDVKNRPLEEALQTHFRTLLAAWMGQMGYEVRGISGGRCDVVFSRGTERLVVEVKRELKDASIASVFTAYGAQTEEYQNSSWRLGILLVLDLTLEHGQGLHMKDAVASRTIQREGESAARTVFLVKVAGRRLTPSGLTNVSSTTGSTD